MEFSDIVVSALTPRELEGLSHTLDAFLAICSLDGPGGPDGQGLRIPVGTPPDPAVVGQLVQMAGMAIRLMSHLEAITQGQPDMESAARLVAHVRRCDVSECEWMVFGDRFGHELVRVMGMAEPRQLATMAATYPVLVQLITIWDNDGPDFVMYLAAGGDPRQWRG